MTRIEVKKSNLGTCLAFSSSTDRKINGRFSIGLHHDDIDSHGSFVAMGPLLEICVIAYVVEETAVDNAGCSSAVATDAGVNDREVGPDGA